MHFFISLMVFSSRVSVFFFFFFKKASLVTQMVKNLPAVQETWVRSLGQEDPLEKEIATHSSICLENSTDREAWWATVHGLAQSQTQRK